MKSWHVSRNKRANQKYKEQETTKLKSDFEETKSQKYSN